MKYPDNFDSTQTELQAALGSFKGTLFSQFEVDVHRTYLTVSAYGAQIDIQAEFEIQNSSMDLTDEEGNLYKQANLSLEVRSQSWSARNLLTLSGVQELLSKVSQAVQDLRSNFGTRDVYWLLLTKEDQTKKAKKFCQEELTELTKYYTKGMRVGGVNPIPSRCLTASNKSRLIPGSYYANIGSRKYLISVSDKKDLEFTRLS